MPEATRYTTHPDGIYFGMADKEYHEDPALGSSNIRDLRRSAPDYWFESFMNPAKTFDDDKTPARIRGKAIHALVLEGKPAFLDRFVRRPDDPPGASPSDKATITKAAKRDLLGNGEDLLHGDEYDRVLQCSVMIAMHPDLGDAFKNGISEVSVFWTRPDGVRCKCRFDYLKPRGFGDLKSITNVMKVDFRQACHNAIAYNGYLAQGVHYLDGRLQIARLWGANKVFGLDEAHLGLMKKIAETKPTGMAWVFYQAEGAPIVYGKALSFGNDLVAIERDKIEAAIKLYRDCMDKFGPATPWILDDPVTELDASDLPLRYA